jgi:pyridoxine kinase
MTLEAAPPPAVLSFQSRVAYGHVGNGAAEFALRRLGLDAWPVDTVFFSNHPGYGGFRGQVRSAAELQDLVDGLNAIGILDRIGAVLSGYLGSRANGGVVLGAVARARLRRSPFRYCCDPVMGDRDSGAYVPPDVIGFFRDEALAAADILTPNHFELELLAGRPLPALDDVRDAVLSLRARGPRMVMVTSLYLSQEPPGTVANLLAGDHGTWMVTTPRLERSPKGAGDLLAALFLGRLQRGEAPAEALSGAVSSTFAVIEATLAAGRPELSLVAAQGEIPSPRRIFPARPLVA